MGSVVVGVGASHSTLMNTHWHAVKHVERAERFRDALGEARQAVVDARPDAVVIFGSNHFRGFYLDLIPAFTVGVGACIASGEAGTPSGPQRVDVPLARHIASALLEESFDIAFSAKLHVDHGITHALQYVLRDLDVPIVPIVINVFAPPLPGLARCAELGAAVRRAIDAFPQRRVAVIASGGLSHRLPWPDWRTPRSDDDAFLVEAFLNGRSNWQEYEGRRRDIVVAATTDPGDAYRVNTAFDREFLTLIENGAVGSALRGRRDLLADAGNGGQEIRTWLAMTGALADTPGRVLAYEDIPEWLTGMAVSVLSASGSERTR